MLGALLLELSRVRPSPACAAPGELIRIRAAAAPAALEAKLLLMRRTRGGERRGEGMRRDVSEM